MNRSDGGGPAAGGKIEFFSPGKAPCSSPIQNLSNGTIRYPGMVCYRVPLRMESTCLFTRLRNRFSSIFLRGLFVLLYAEKNSSGWS